METIITERGSRINVDNYDSWDGKKEVWVTIAVPMSSTSAVLTKEQAKKLAAALLSFAEAV